MTLPTDLPDLASEALGGWAMWANDEFFAEKENLLKAHAAEWREHAYTDRGKWMDGWETRRRREPGHDICVIRLGLPGILRAAVVDTAFFRGNYPAECMIEASRIEGSHDLRAIHDPATHWVTILPRSPLKGDSRNDFALAGGDTAFTHVRMTIFPDGGVARLRIHGEPSGRWQSRAHAGVIDLAALENGARSLACSDMFFGSRNNLILPGKPLTMGGGWETRRRRGPGHDWNLVALAAAGRVLSVEVDTMHFKGNAPGRCSIDACHAPGATGVDALASADWRVLLPETPLQPHTLHVFEDELRVLGPVTHVRLNVFPDGGVARLRCFGEIDAAPAGSDQLTTLNQDSIEDAREKLRACCASSRWVDGMLRARPFESPASLSRIADRIWWRECAEADWLEAFAAHPRIGDKSVPAGQSAQHAAWSAKEQRGAESAEAETLSRLSQLNQAYADKFGFTYIVCATGKSAAQMLSLLEQRLTQSREPELRTAAEEQAKIIQLRLRKLLGGTR